MGVLEYGNVPESFVKEKQTQDAVIVFRIAVISMS